MRCLAAGLSTLFLVACGPSQDDAHDAGGTPATGILALTTTASAWESSLPPGTGSPMPAQTITVRGCSFAVGTAILTPPGSPPGGVSPPPFPPLFLAYVERGSTGRGPRWCEPGFIVFGASAAADVEVDVAARPGKPFLVLDYTYRVTQDGHQRLGIVELDVFTGQTLCTTGLSALSSPSATGDVSSGTLRLDAHGTLTVTGTKDGTIPGETGSGSRYVAVWSDFLGAGACASSPTSVVAF